MIRRNGNSHLTFAMLHRHWTELSATPNAVEKVLLSGFASAGGKLVADVAGPSDFYRPIRFTASRTDLAGASGPESLAACAPDVSPERPSTGSEEPDWDL